MSQRLIDVPLHDLSSTQILEQMMRFFQDNKAEPVVVLTNVGRGSQTIQTVRANLSHQRRGSKSSGLSLPAFGFKVVSSPISMTLNGRLVEATGVIYHQTKRQQMMNFTLDMFDVEIQEIENVG